MHIAAVAPKAVRREEFDAELLAHEESIFKAQAMESGKPAEIAEKMVKGRVEKLFKEQVLMEQPFVKDPDMTVEDRLKTTISKLGENMVVRRFTRYELGTD
jgi:elongation factor Ts